MKPAIVLSAHTMGLAVIRGLGMMGVPIVTVYYNKGDMGYVSKYVTQRILAPHPEESEEQFVDLLVELSNRFNGGLLIPTDDATVATVSRHKSLLEKHYIVACTEWEITKQFIDKKHTYALADAVGVPAPKTIVPQSIEAVERYDQEIQYPCLVKPSQSHLYYEHFGKKMVQVDNLDQMLDAYQQAENLGLEVMLQELIPGGDSLGVTYHSYSWNGEQLVEFTAQQIRNGPPEFGSPRVTLSKHIPEVLDPARRFLNALGYYGFAGLEFKQDPRDGVYKLMELNGRHCRASILDVRCGINFPWLQYRHLVHDELPSASDFEEDVYWIAEERDLGYSLMYYKPEKYSLFDYLRPYLNPHKFATFDIRDPKPFIKRVVNVIGGAIE